MNDYTTVVSWGETLTTAFQNLWIKSLSYLPELFGAIVLLVIGLILASLLGKLARQVISYARIDAIFERIGLSREVDRFGVQFSFSGLVGWLVKWFFILATLIAVADTLNIPQVTAFLTDVALYIPNVVAAIIILAIGVVVGRFVSEIIERTVKASHVAKTVATTLATIAKWAIVVFAFMAALVQLGVARSLIQILFTGFVAMLALAGGLAFGLGGRDQAGRVIDSLSKELSRRE
ncbi:hypothetical protein COV04_03365 [Candidatus Uhrbacteria bacterium CG10_big_fil_rev_8_21_14_0_10_48_11]|uniref:Small-conductance mechanosensitive ion channel n=1 Tax=Candidatus Uhrbacteria bacterium CG10_big_fil_rev_8_21_14_0_10_48_11 TaxID=1975037 RepID=A0A2M8LE50_9BACT|nr:MAG: hypothetical protein COV04_03365 [Candidatus Uhrbacteria bacterium CG10_big_fil_rev_8_21_14_0_10_48_11]